MRQYKFIRYIFVTTSIMQILPSLYCVWTWWWAPFLVNGTDQWAATLMMRLRSDGVWWVPLLSESDSQAVLNAIIIKELRFGDITQYINMQPPLVFFRG